MHITSLPSNHGIGTLGREAYRFVDFLKESGISELCDKTIAVTAPTELRVRRIMARDGISEQYARMRITAQKPDEYYRTKCDCELTNAADTPESFREEAREFIRRLMETIKEEKTHGNE